MEDPKDGGEITSLVRKGEKNSILKATFPNGIKTKSMSTKGLSFMKLYRIQTTEISLENVHLSVALLGTLEDKIELCYFPTFPKKRMANILQSI